MGFRRFLALLVLPILLALVGCDLEREVEKLLGAIAQTFWELGFERSDDPLLTELVESVGKRVAEVSPRKDMPVKFKVINLGEVNAVALPNGRIYIFRGMIETVSTEDELAAVLAHEVGHVAGRHSLKQFRLSLGIGLLVDLLNLNRQSDFVQNLANFATALYQLGYSRQHERDADNYALKLALFSGYDPKGSVELFEKFAKGEGKPSRWLIYLSTHPPSRERLEKAKRANEDLGRIHPDLPAFAAHTLVANGYAQRGLYRHAVLHYEKAMQLQPRHVPALLGLAQAKEALQEFDESRNWYERVLEVEPQNEEAKQGLKRLNESQINPVEFRPCDEKEKQISTKVLEEALAEWEIVQKQWQKQWLATTGMTNAVIGQVQKLWSQMRSLPLQSQNLSIAIDQSGKRNSQSKENFFSFHETMRLRNLMKMRDEVANECAQTLITFQIAVAEFESLLEDAKRATEIWQRALSDWQQMVAKGQKLPEGSIENSNACSRILFRTVIAAEKDSQSVRDIERQLSKSVFSLAEAINLMHRQKSSFVLMAETKLQIAKSDLQNAKAELNSLLAKTSEKRTKVDKALLSAYQTRLSALEAKTNTLISQKVVAYHLRVSENQIASLRSKLPDMGSVAIIATFAKAKNTDPEKLLSEVDLKSNWLDNLLQNRAPVGVRVALKWLTTAWERDWDLASEKVEENKQKGETNSGEELENGKQ